MYTSLDHDLRPREPSLILRHNNIRYEPYKAEVDPPGDDLDRQLVVVEQLDQLRRLRELLRVTESYRYEYIV